MAFGPIMKLTTDAGDHIELAPFTREDSMKFVDGFAKHSVTQYLSHGTAPTKETEEEWYDKMVRDKTCRVWGIWLVEGGVRKLIGSTALTDLIKKHIYQAMSGSNIFEQQYWGRGIASACHKARTQFAFEQLGLHRIKSAVLQANGGSHKALERCGYTLVYTERNELFVNGGLMHQDCLECLNPADWAWRQWWGNDHPPLKNLEARKRTEAALAWAREHVELI